MNHESGENPTVSVAACTSKWKNLMAKRSVFVPSHARCVRRSIPRARLLYSRFLCNLIIIYSHIVVSVCWPPVFSPTTRSVIMRFSPETRTWISAGARPACELKREIRRTNFCSVSVRVGRRRRRIKWNSFQLPAQRRLQRGIQIDDSQQWK